MNAQEVCEKARPDALRSTSKHAGRVGARHSLCFVRAMHPVFLTWLFLAVSSPVLTSPSPRTSMGSVEVPAAADRVFAALADPRVWSKSLGDVTNVEVEKQPGRYRVWSRVLGHAHIVDLRSEQNHLIHFHVVDAGPGGAVVVDIKLVPTAPGTTRILYTMSTALPLGLDRVVDDETVRRVRERKILADLADLSRFFSGR